jgi:hypothetical protein
MRVSARERVSLLPFCYHTTRIVTDQHAQGGTDITWLRALKIWWSFSWRAFVLMLLVMVPLEAVFFWYAMSNGGQPRRRDADGGDDGRHLADLHGSSNRATGSGDVLDAEQGALVRFSSRCATP